MSDLIVIAFPDAAQAFRARAEFLELQRDYLVEMEDVVVVTRSAEGQVQLHQAVNMTAAGAMGGTLWGTLIGMLFLNPLLGAAVGAASGALGGALTDLGIDDGFLRDVGGSLDQGGAALAVLLRKFTADRVIDRLQAMGGRILQTSLPQDIEARLRDRLEGRAMEAASTAVPQMPSEATAAAPAPGLGGAPGTIGMAATPNTDPRASTES
ncbi:hypothetical protein Rumeso_03781 [Rubellimicrobium mesophilum DSM 19309]|uniref:Membrane protein of uknown function UCP014873 n=1 Tax=Rubellimicrobium mesophilum DSM 19309 TaxID=442562 RepID=A0A017HK16_9RHOB|nr:DUF1269 domain-containing protein [Rubellimicrobium mesophilum]EYD74665.1 hypothetical protein Rumeso_03781 [Rubellimicrobium mesophilum DSM 19309]